MELTLESLGITQQEAVNRLIETLANRLLTSKGCGQTDDGEGEVYEFTAESPFGKALKEMVQQRIEVALAAIVEKHILPNVEQYIENVTLQATNEWGEAKGKPATFIEYLTERAESYMIEKVDFNGKTKSEEHGYSWKGTQTRIAHMIHRHLHYAIETAMETALKNGLSTIVKGIEETAKLKLAEISKSLKVQAVVKA